MPGVIPERIEGETPKAYRAFVDYCEMGTGRTIRKLHQACIEDVSRHHRLGTLLKWSTENSWQERVAEYERRAAEVRAQARIQAQIDLEDGVLRDAADMLDFVLQRWGKYRQTPAGVSTYDLRQIIHARRDLDDLARRSAGLPNTVSESTVKGTGKGGAVQVEHVTPIAYVEVVPPEDDD